MRGVPYGPPDGGKGMGWRGVVSVSADLLRAVACLFLGRFTIFFFTAQNFITNIFYFQKNVYFMTFWPSKCDVKLFCLLRRGEEEEVDQKLHHRSFV